MLFCYSIFLPSLSLLCLPCLPLTNSNGIAFQNVLNGDRCRFHFIMIFFIFGLGNRTNLFIFFIQFLSFGLRLMPSILLLFLIHVFNSHFDECPFVLGWFLPNDFVWVVCWLFNFVVVWMHQFWCAVK